jgi:hypothetical protein
MGTRVEIDRFFLIDYEGLRFPLDSVAGTFEPARCAGSFFCGHRRVGRQAGILRNEIAKRFQLLIAEMSNVKSTISSSLNCGFTASQTASGT